MARAHFTTTIREGEAPAEPRFVESSARPEPRPPGFETASRRGEVEAPFDPIAEVLSRGWAFAEIGYSDIQPDRANQWQQGVIGLTLQEGQTQPAPDEWSTISAWAWGASRVVDYLESDDSIDQDRIAIAGASRLEKTALWAAALDDRISAVLSVVPGAMVAAGPVYQLLGASGLGADPLPDLDKPITNGHLAFHYHSQGHRAVPEDWRQFLQFAERHYASRNKSSTVAVIVRNQSQGSTTNLGFEKPPRHDIGLELSIDRQHCQ